MLPETIPRRILSHIASRVAAGKWSIEEWPVARVLWLAWFAVHTRPLGWCPGWSFGFGDASTDPVLQLRKRLWQYFASRQSQASFSVRWYDGLKLRLYPGNDLSWAMFIGGCCEPNEFAFLDAVLHPGSTFVDVGANDGMYTLFAARRVGAQGTVLALEPSGREFERLQRNLQLNGLRNVRSLRIAASNRHGEATLRVAAYGHEGHNTLGSFVYETALLREETVTVAPLDDVVERQGLAAVGAIKMDVEGGEFAALDGARNILARDHPILLLEVNDEMLRRQGSSRDALTDLLHASDYETYVFDSVTGRPVPGAQPPAEDPNVIAVHRTQRALMRRFMTNGGATP